MALYITHSIFHLARLLYVRPETFEPYYLPYLYVQPSSWRWIFRFETCRRHQKLKYEYRKGAFCWFILYNCITMHGAKNIKMPSVIHDLHYHLALIIPHNNKVHKPLCALHRHYRHTDIHISTLKFTLSSAFYIAVAHIWSKNVPQQTLNITHQHLDLRFDRTISGARDSCKYQTR